MFPSMAALYCRRVQPNLGQFLSLLLVLTRSMLEVYAAGCRILNEKGSAGGRLVGRKSGKISSRAELVTRGAGLLERQATES